MAAKPKIKHDDPPQAKRFIEAARKRKGGTKPGRGLTGHLRRSQSPRNRKRNKAGEAERFGPRCRSPQPGWQADRPSHRPAPSSGDMEPPPTINLQDERGAAVLRPTSLQEWTTEPPAAKSEKRGRRAATTRCVLACRTTRSENARAIGPHST
jgi:hypothetical protein